MIKFKIEIIFTMEKSVISEEQQTIEQLEQALRA